MAISSIPRFLSHSIRSKVPRFSSPNYTTSSASDKFWDCLLRNGGNIEKSLATVQAKLDSSSVTQILHRSSKNQSQLGLRFFIWAGLQSSYRHSSYMYSKACKLFEISKNPEILTDVIEGYRVEACFVSVKTFKVVLNLCREAKLAEEGLWVLRKMQEFSCRPDTTTYNVVVRLFCEKTNMDMAECLMKEMGSIDLYPDMITYVAMIKGFCSAGRLEDACGLFKLMREHGCSPNVVAYSALLDGVFRFGSSEKGMDLLREMGREGDECSPNVVSYTCVIQNFCEKGNLVEALGIFDHMEARGCAPNRVTSDVLIRFLCAEGRLKEAYKLIDRLVSRGSVSKGDCFSSLLVSLLRFKELKEAENLFEKMLATAVKPDGLACSLLIRELCFKGRMLDGFSVYCKIEKMGYLSSIDTDVYSILLVGLCEGSHFVEAAKLARLMLERGVRLKAPYVYSIVERLNDSGDDELVRKLTRTGI